MIPYFEQPSVSFGPVTIHAFGVIVATSVVVGEQLYRQRIRSLRLDTDVASGLAWYALIFGFLSAHFFAVLFYFPEKVARDPWSLLRLWEDLSSFGGMLGGAIGAVVFLKLKGSHLSRRQRWGYLDAVAFVVPFGWAVGRLACAVAHDHPGRITRFPLAISLESADARTFITGQYRASGRPLPQLTTPEGLGFHDLGLYEMLLLALVLGPLFLLVDRSRIARTREAGFWVGLFCVCYGAMRIMLDTLRIADARYFGLTPGQYLAIAMLFVGSGLLLRRNVNHPEEAPEPLPS